MAQADSQPPQEPQRPQSAAMISATLIGLYMWAQSALLGGVARIAKRSPLSVDGGQAALADIRRLSQSVSNRLGAESAPLVDALVRQSGREGGRDGGNASGGGRGGNGGGFAPPPEFGDDDPRNLYMLHGERAARAVAFDLQSELDDVRFRITRLDDDLFKELVAPHAIAQVLPNGLTPQDAQAAAWREFTRRGVTGFTDKGGRRWSMSAYVEMAVRTATVRAYNIAHLAVMQANGHNLVVVSDDGHPCPLCLPWQNVVLCIVPDGIHPSIEDAIRAGLMHPNCRHKWSAYIPGFTILPPAQEWTPAHQAAYDATQKQRRLELDIRKAKQQLEYARTPLDRRDARDDVRKAQARIRLFLAEQQYDLLRHSRREQLNLSLR
jgi:hypothetical protein